MTSLEGPRPPLVSMTRLDCVMGSAAGMRAAVVQAVHHASPRSAFGGRLVDKPLMGNLLADLHVESGAATTLMLRLAGAVDRAQGSEGRSGDAQEQAFTRIATAVGKYWVCKRGPAVATEALECLGRNGYVEESGMPRLYREAPLNSIWEGSGNVNALDVLRAVAKEPASVEAYFAEVDRARGADARLDDAVLGLRAGLARPARPRGAGPAPRRADGPRPAGVPCSCVTGRRRSRPPSARAAWPATGAMPSAPRRGGSSVGAGERALPREEPCYGPGVRTGSIHAR